MRNGSRKRVEDKRLEAQNGTATVVLHKPKHHGSVLHHLPLQAMSKDARKRSSAKGPQKIAVVKQSIKKKQKKHSKQSKQSLTDSREALDSRAQEIYAVSVKYAINYMIEMLISAR